MLYGDSWATRGRERSGDWLRAKETVGVRSVGKGTGVVDTDADSGSLSNSLFFPDTDTERLEGDSDDDAGRTPATTVSAAASIDDASVPSLALEPADPDANSEMEVELVPAPVAYETTDPCDMIDPGFVLVRALGPGELSIADGDGRALGCTCAADDVGVDALESASDEP